MAKVKPITFGQAKRVEALVRGHYDGAEGLVLVMDWDWPSSGPTPTLIWEGGPFEWAMEMSALHADIGDQSEVFCEPYSGWALCLYRP